MPTRILVVEDEPLQRTVLRNAFRGAGYDVETCVNGMDAVWMIREGRFDVALVDYRLPEIDGLATARLVHELMGDTARPCLVALTAAPDCVNERELAGRAFDGIVAKSSDIGGMLAAVEGFLDGRPDSDARRRATDMLTFKDWTRFDVEPFRPEAVDGTLAQLRVLVAEDDPLQRSVLRASLETMGYQVETACDGLETFRCLCKRAYDLALIDYNMPEFDGLAAAQLMVEVMSDAARPRMIAFTAAVHAVTERQAAVGRSFDAVVSKQAGLADLMAVVDRELGPARLRLQRREKVKAASQGSDCEAACCEP